MGTTRDLAEFAHETSFRDFDQGLVKHVKNVLLSGVGMTVAGLDTNTGKAVTSYVKECTAPQEAGVFGAGFRTSAEYAALANGTMSHATELEDDIMPELIYSVGIFPGVFALGEKLHASGKEVLEASIVAWDVATKLASPAIKPILRRGGVGPCFCAIGVAAASARLLKLGLDQTVMTMSIAASHANWLILRQSGSGTHLFEAGLAGRNGIAAAMLAKHGLTGQSNIYEMPLGFLYGVVGDAYSIPKLGAPYRARDIGIKKYPCCYLEMHIIDGFLELIRDNKISADSVESVQVDVSQSFADTVRFHHPRDEEEARFSLPHSVACCFLEGEPWIESYSNGRVNDPRVRAFRDRVKMGIYPTLPDDPVGGRETPISIRLRDGTEYRKVCPRPSDPLEVSDGEVMDKYMKCALRVFSRSRAESIADAVLSLEKIPDISEVTTSLTYPDH